MWHYEIKDNTFSVNIYPPTGPRCVSACYRSRWVTSAFLMSTIDHCTVACLAVLDYRFHVMRASACWWVDALRPPLITNGMLRCDTGVRWCLFTGLLLFAVMANYGGKMTILHEDCYCLKPHCCRCVHIVCFLSGWRYWCVNSNGWVRSICKAPYKCNVYRTSHRSVFCRMSEMFRHAW